MSIQDPIVEEVRQVREAYARRMNFDLQAIADDSREKEQLHSERLVSYPARPVRKKKTA